MISYLPVSKSFKTEMMLKQHKNLKPKLDMSKKHAFVLAALGVYCIQL